MRYTNKLNLPIIEDSDNFALAFTQPNEIAEKLEEAVGTYGDTVEALNELQNVVNATNESIGNVNDELEALDKIEHYDFVDGDYTITGNACKIVAFTNSLIEIKCPAPYDNVPVAFLGTINLTPMLNKLGVNINNVQILNIEFIKLSSDTEIDYPIYYYINKNNNEVSVRCEANELPEGQSFTRTIRLSYTVTMLIKKNVE